jgi:hypothetical protein
LSSRFLSNHCIRPKINDIVTSRLGLIEFVPNVRGVNEFLSDQMDEKELERHKNGHQMFYFFVCSARV